MDAMLPSRLGKLRIICSLPLFSDAICIKRQSAAEHAFTQVLLTIGLAPQLEITEQEELELLELTIFAELPKSYLGDPSFYLRQRHPEAEEVYKQVRGRLWIETEQSMGLKTTRCKGLFGIHNLVDAFASMLFIEKECLLGNSYFASERYHGSYNRLRQRALKKEALSKSHPASKIEGAVQSPLENQLPWLKAVSFLDTLFDESVRARLEGGLAEYSSTFIGMMEKLKEHYRYKGWSYHFPESVGEHTFQVVFIARLIADVMELSTTRRLQLYRLAALHDLAEAYASDVVYPVKMRERDLASMHQRLENDVITEICCKLGIAIHDDEELHSIMEICDRFSAKLYFDREVRAGNTHFNVPNISMDGARKKYEPKYPKVFNFLDELWHEYVSCF